MVVMGSKGEARAQAPDAGLHRRNRWCTGPVPVTIVKATTTNNRPRTAYARVMHVARIDDQMRLPLVLILGALLAMVTFPVFAAGEEGAELDWGVMAMQLFGGLALFLFGMEQMADALKAVAGERMKTILAKLTTNRFMGRRHRRLRHRGHPVVLGHHRAGGGLHHRRPDVPVAVDRRHHGRQHRHHDHRPDRRLQGHQGRAADDRRRLLMLFVVQDTKRSSNTAPCSWAWAWCSSA